MWNFWASWVCSALPRHSLQLHAARFSGSLQQVLRVFRDTCLNRSWSKELWLSVSCFSSWGVQTVQKSRGGLPLERIHHARPPVIQNIITRPLQIGTEMLWLCLPCESNKASPSDYFSRAWPTARGHWAMVNSSNKSCMLKWSQLVKKALQAAARWQFTSLDKTQHPERRFACPTPSWDCSAQFVA